MAFRFKLNEPVQGALRRIGSEQIERAQTQLAAASGDRDGAIHETRKALKRLRALLKLVRSGLADGVFLAENARLRSIAAILAPSRDTAILAETVAKLESLSGHVSSAALAATRKILAEDAGQARPGQDSDIEKARTKLGTALRKIRRLTLSPANFSTLQRGLERSYKRGQRGYALAYKDESDATFHEWRKSVQQHWRHMSLVSRAWPDYFDARVAAARGLSQILGEDHDLAVLVDYVRSLPVQRLPAMLVLEIERLAKARQGELRKLAEPRGRQLYVEGAKGHGRRIGVLWKAAEDIDRDSAPEKTVSGAAPKRLKAVRR